MVSRKQIQSVFVSALLTFTGLVVLEKFSAIHGLFFSSSPPPQSSLQPSAPSKFTSFSNTRTDHQQATNDGGTVTKKANNPSLSSSSLPTTAVPAPPSPPSLPSLSASTDLDQSGGSDSRSGSKATTTTTVAINTASSSSSSSAVSASNSNSVGPKTTPFTPNHYTNRMPHPLGLTWTEFLNLPRHEKWSSVPANKRSPLVPSYVPLFCPPEMVANLTAPTLSAEDTAWCEWAVSPTGGKVVVGKSWGTIASDKGKKEKFDLLNCNAYITSGKKNPSCNDAWGDEHLRHWRQSPVASIACQPTRTSSVHCFDNENTDRMCYFDNAMINFDRYSTKARPSTTESKDFQKDFFSVDCDPQSTGDYLKFKHLYSTKLSTERCDYVINGTVLLFSHDDIRNLGHTMNDIMNVWVMLWFNQVARFAGDITFLNVDSFNLGHNFHDNPDTCAFYTTYKKNFQTMLRGEDFKGKTVCMQRVLMQPSPPKFFVWESWFFDNKCTFKGPSSLFQRFNLAVRESYGLLHSTPDHYFTNKQIRIVMIVRKQMSNMWGNSQTSRNTKNQEEVDDVLKKTLARHPRYASAVINSVSFEDMPFEEQIALAAETTLFIGMHGAGLTLGLHMAIGTKFCCGVIEIFPLGSYTPIRGHGNMFRRAGVKFDRIDVSAKHSLGDGAFIPAEELAEKVVHMLDDITLQPSCVLRNAYNDPYLEGLLD